MRERSFLGVAGLLIVGCAGTVPPVASPAGSGGTPVSKQLHWELTSVADELNYEDPCPLMVAAKTSGYDECLVSFDCTYCRMRGGWWMLQGCESQPAREAALTCDQQARCGLRDAT
ncbi:MAG: hypothetical protein ABW252_15450 [Polyangiales bacterium]